MTYEEFSQKCVEYNKRYREIFGYVPRPSEYLFKYEEYIEALKKSIETKKPIDVYLKKAGRPLEPDALT